MRLEQMEIFYFVALWNSFSRAAIHLRLSKGYVSREITSLEKELKVRLFNRTTRHVGLTAEGEIFFGNCSRIVEEKNMALNQIMELSDNPSGNMTISAPPSICENILCDIIPSFCQKYPAITLTIDASSTVKNLSQYGIDVALRLTNNPDEDYIARKIKSFRFVLCGSKGYFKEHGMPQKAEDVLDHKCLVYSNDPKGSEWLIGDKRITIKGVISTNNPELIMKLALQDIGIAKLPDYMFNKHIDMLEEILSQKNFEELAMYAIYKNGRNIPLKVRCFLNFLRDWSKNYEST